VSEPREPPDLVVRGDSRDPEEFQESAVSPESESLDDPEYLVQLVRGALLDLAEALGRLGPGGSLALRAALDLPDSLALKGLADSASLGSLVRAASAGLLVPPGSVLSAPDSQRQLELPVGSPSQPSTSGGSTERRR